MKLQATVPQWQYSFFAARCQRRRGAAIPRPSLQPSLFPRRETGSTKKKKNESLVSDAAVGARHPRCGLHNGERYSERAPSALNVRGLLSRIQLFPPHRFTSTWCAGLNRDGAPPTFNSAPCCGAAAVQDFPPRSGPPPAPLGAPSERVGRKATAPAKPLSEAVQHGSRYRGTAAAPPRLAVCLKKHSSNLFNPL